MTDHPGSPSHSRARARLKTVGMVVVMLCSAAAGAAACSADDATPLSDPQAEAGRTLYSNLGCAGCHGREGQGGSGPTLKGLPGSQVELEDGSTLTADDAYLRESIRNPGAKITKGYGNNMVRVNVSDQQLEQLVAYLRTFG